MTTSSSYLIMANVSEDGMSEVERRVFALTLSHKASMTFGEADCARRARGNSYSGLSGRCPGQETMVEFLADMVTTVPDGTSGDDVKTSARGRRPIDRRLR